MNRLFSLILLTLLLCGCAVQQNAEPTTPSGAATKPAAEPTEPAGIYVPNSELEAQTGGAVRCYLPDVSDAYGIRTAGEDLLIFSGTENTTLTRCTGEKLYSIARIQLDCRIEPEDTSFLISGNGITYYDPETNELIFLDNDLKEVRRLALPGTLVGKPVLSADRSLVYYCTAEAVRVLDISTGLDKLLKNISYPGQSVEAVLMNGAVLRCDLMDHRGGAMSVFLSTQTGELVHELVDPLEMTSRGDFCYARITEGILQQVLFYHPEQQIQVLYPADPFADAWILDRTHSVVTASGNEDGLLLESYDLASGLRTASLELQGGLIPRAVESRGDTEKVYILAQDAAADTMVICQWDRSASPVEDPAVYTGPRYTAKNPDEAGLIRCAALAERISQTYGVEVLIASQAVAQQPWDYTLEQEYQIPVIEEQLAVLADVLSHFPAGFFEKIHGTTKLCIVRSITGNAQSGSVAAAQGIQFWPDEDAHVVLAAGESLEQTFYHEIFHVIDSYVLSVCRNYYYWHNLNPEGCEYFEDYTSYLTADVSEYLQEEDRAFIDAYSMCYPREDRARIMEYACMEGNAHYFQSDIMQSKLKTLCEGIRQAFGLEKTQESFLWEQYLREPLTNQ